MIFDKEIKVLESCNQKRKDYKSKLAEEIKRNDAEIFRIRQKNVTKKIRSKVNDIYSVVFNTAQELLDAEKKITAVNNRFATGLQKLNAQYDEANFLAELKKSYDDFCSFTFNLNKGGIASVNENVLLKAAKGYLVICDIHKNLDGLLGLYVQEERVKKQAVEQLEKDKSKSKNDGDVWLTNDMAETQILLTELDNKIADMKDKVKGSFFTPECKMEASFNEKVSLNIGVATDSDSKERNIKLDEYGRTLKIPKSVYSYDVDLTEGLGNIVIAYSDSDKDSDRLLKCIESIMMKFVLCYPARFKNIAIIHNVMMVSKFIDVMGKLQKCCDNNELWFDSTNKYGSNGVSNERSKIVDCLSSIGAYLGNRQTILAGYKNIFEYNKKNSDNVQALTLLIVKDLDKRKNEEAIEYVKEIAKRGEKLGVYILLLGEIDSLIENFGEVLTKNFNNHFEYCDGKLLTESAEIDCCGGYECLNAEFYEKVKKQVKNYSNAIDLLEFQHGIKIKDEIKNNFSAVLKIPIGKRGSEVEYLELDTTSNHNHAVISGTNGTGKTSLLHSIILGAAYQYSPKEVEIWLFDFKEGGMEFNKYKDNDINNGLKHVKVVVLNSHKQDVYDILDYLVSRMEERGDKIKKQGKQNIKDYNNVVPDNDKLPRILVIIDEYTVLSSSQNCIAKLEDVAKRGRAFGISLIISSQEADSSFSSVTGQMMHRFEFTQNPARTILLTKDPSEFGNFSVIKGTCIYERRNNAVKMRSAYAHSIETAIDEINEKYCEFEYEQPVVLGEAEIIRKPAPFGKGNKIGEYKNDLMRLELGLKNLSRQPVKYKIDRDNRKLLLLGDSERANHFEYAIADSFARLREDKPSAFYLSSQRNSNEIMSKFRENYEGNGIFFAQKPAEVLEGLKRLYDIYTERRDMLDDGLEINYPVEIILHNFDRLQEALLRFKNREQERPSSFASNELTKEEIQQMAEKMSEEEFSRWLDARDSFESSNNKNYPEWSEILQELFNADTDCKINMVVHFGDPNTYERASRVLYGRGDRYEFKDAVIFPKIPEEDEPISYQFIVDCLRLINGQAVREFSDLYVSRNSSSLTQTSREEINNFNYVILIDEHIPSKYLPYEYYEEQD